MTFRNRSVVFVFSFAILASGCNLPTLFLPSEQTLDGSSTTSNVTPTAEQTSVSAGMNSSHTNTPPSTSQSTLIVPQQDSKGGPVSGSLEADFGEVDVEEIRPSSPLDDPKVLKFARPIDIEYLRTVPETMSLSQISAAYDRYRFAREVSLRFNAGGYDRGTDNSDDIGGHLISVPEVLSRGYLDAYIRLYKNEDIEDLIGFAGSEDKCAYYLLPKLLINLATNAGEIDKTYYNYMKSKQVFGSNEFNSTMYAYHKSHGWPNIDDADRLCTEALEPQVAYKIRAAILKPVQPELAALKDALVQMTIRYRERSDYLESVAGDTGPSGNWTNTGSNIIWSGNPGSGGQTSGSSGAWTDVTSEAASDISVSMEPVGNYESTVCEGTKYRITARTSYHAANQKVSIRFNDACNGSRTIEFNFTSTSRQVTSLDTPVLSDTRYSVIRVQKVGL